MCAGWSMCVWGCQMAQYISHMSFGANCTCAPPAMQCACCRNVSEFFRMLGESAIITAEVHSNLQRGQAYGSAQVVSRRQLPSGTVAASHRCWRLRLLLTLRLLEPTSTRTLWPSLFILLQMLQEEWLQEYARGASHSVYQVQLHEHFSNHRFRALCDTLYTAHEECMLLGVRSKAYQGKILLNPGAPVGRCKVFGDMVCCQPPFLPCPPLPSSFRCGSTPKGVWGTSQGCLQGVFGIIKNQGRGAFPNPLPPSPDQSAHCKKFTIGKSGRAIFGSQTLGSQTPSPASPPLLKRRPGCTPQP